MDNTSNALRSVSLGYCARAEYASHPLYSRGRLIKEPESPTRTVFQRDRDRIIHSNAFRRLKHKTQVFIAADGDHYRTRLTHTIEVAQIARALARSLRLDEDLAETIALAHDLGHTPFGHAGEDSLNELMADYGGFDHNAQALRIVTMLEKRYAGFDGLNLTWETLEGLVKHNGPLKGAHANQEHLPHFIAQFNAHFDLNLDQFASLEAQCAAIADDIAYDAHDIDDGLRAKLLDIDELAEVAMVGDILSQTRKRHPQLDPSRLGYEIVRQQISKMTEDVIGESFRRLDEIKPQSIADIYQAKKQIIAFSPAMAKHEKALKTFLYNKLYYHPNVSDKRQMAQKAVKELFQIYMNDKTKLPREWQLLANNLPQNEYARLICDFISGMTDNYALGEHKRLSQ